MSKFDTHGDYFAPQGYMRVNAGGSHEENPNGGVQVGVDPEGVPNVLEEGEPVYNDYVYSDNIVADKDILEKNNIPTKYAGKLYSEIADIFVDEVAETPLDPIANNGLNSTLVRLADAQEEQKAIEQQKQLEEELAQMSPEELAELEALLSEQEQVPTETPMMNTPVQEMPQGLMMKCGGKINRYDWGSFLNQVRNYTGSRAKSTDKHYRIDPNFYKRYGFNSIEDLENSEPYKAFTRYVLANSNNPEVLDYLRAIDTGVAQGNNVPMLFDSNGNLRDNWQDQYIRLRNDQKGGIYHFMGDTENDYNNLSGLFNDNAVTPAMVRALEDEPIVDEILSVNGYQPTRSRVTPGDTMLREIVDDARVGNTNPFSDTTLRREQRALPVWPRYAGAATAGLLGLHNVFQEPDRYDLPHVNPVLPYGRMHLIDPVYNPLDQNQVTNTLLANAAGTSRAIRNSGNNPSVGATLLAQDYNTGRNMGNAATTVWDANNQRRNAVIAGHNQNASTLGNFHYGQNRDRAQTLNSFALHNANNDWRNQYMNYQAEAQKYAAIQQQLDNLADALSAIGQENFAMNQLNSNSALNYGVRRNGVGYYQGFPFRYSCGGKMKR